MALGASRFKSRSAHCSIIDVWDSVEWKLMYAAFPTKANSEILWSHGSLFGFQPSLLLNSIPGPAQV